MIIPKMAICPICGKKTYLRIQEAEFYKQYPIRINCFNCRALIKGVYDMSKPKGQRLMLFNAEQEECDVDKKTMIIRNADYTIEISGELPCQKVMEFDGKVKKTT